MDSGQPDWIVIIMGVGAVILYFLTCRHPDHNDNTDHASSNKKKVPHVKKPLNAFMLFMKEMRAKVIEECALKESAAINQILGRRVSRLRMTIASRVFLALQAARYGEWASSS